MKKIHLFLSLSTALTTGTATAAESPAPTAVNAAKPPNVIVILTDDQGYQDAGCYGADARHFTTPNMDRFAKEGLRFTDGHAASSVCTPSRYSLLTGEYAFRNRKGGGGVLPGDAALTITPGSFTLPAMFKSKGYATGFVGKWHLGLAAGGKSIDWNGDVKPGPLEIGFDSCFYFPATPDRTPTVYIRNHRVENLDPKDPIEVSYTNAIGETCAKDPELLTVLKPINGHNQAVTNGVGRIGFMKGGHAARWVDEKMTDTLNAEAVSFVEKHKDQPFFLYYATYGIHEGRVPAPRFRGKSGAGTYGDHLMELDDDLGRLLDTLKRLNLDHNTLIVYSSDNGGCTYMGYDYGDRQSLNGHKVNGPLHGEKGSVFEGGTRVPFMVRWPGHLSNPGSDSAALVSQTDLLASFASLLDIKLPADAAGDSINVLGALLGKSATGRKELVEHAYNGTNEEITGRMCALRQGTKKYINGELYDLTDDLAETHNLAKDQPELANAMKARLDELIHSAKTRQ